MFCCDRQVCNLDAISSIASVLPDLRLLNLDLSIYVFDFELDGIDLDDVRKMHHKFFE